MKLYLKGSILSYYNLVVNVPGIPALLRQWPEDCCKFKACLAYIARSRPASAIAGLYQTTEKNKEGRSLLLAFPFTLIRRNQLSLVAEVCNSSYSVKSRPA